MSEAAKQDEIITRVKELMVYKGSRSVLAFDLVFFASAKLKSELSTLLSASGSLRDGFGICEYGSLCYSPKQVPSKSQLSPIIFPQSCELDGRRMGEGWEMKGKERGKVNGKTQILGCLSVIVYVKKTIF